MGARGKLPWLLPPVGGTGLEQYEKLSAVIHKAHKRHQSLALCWLDLANAYGSVHYHLIQFALKHYHPPQSFAAVVSSLYSGLRSTITSRFDPCRCTQSRPALGIHLHSESHIVECVTVCRLYLPHCKWPSLLSTTVGEGRKVAPVVW